jgi:gas vesicle protein
VTGAIVGGAVGAVGGLLYDQDQRGRHGGRHYHNY